jgi:hypothetical protein
MHLLTPFLIVYLGFTLCSAFAQDNTQKKDVRKFSAYAWFESIDHLKLSKTGSIKTSTSLNIPNGSRSPFYELGDAPYLDFYREGYDDKGNPILIKVITVPINPEIKQPLLLFFADKLSTYGQPVDLNTVNYRVSVLEDSPEFFPPDTLRIINQAKQTLAIRYGNGQSEVEHGKDEIIFPKIEPTSDRTLQVAAFDKINQRWDLFINSPMLGRPRQRLLLLISTDLTGEFQPVILRDFIAKEDPPVTK